MTGVGRLGGSAWGAEGRGPSARQGLAGVLVAEVGLEEDEAAGLAARLRMLGVRGMEVGGEGGRATLENSEMETWMGGGMWAGLTCGWWWWGGS